MARWGKDINSAEAIHLVWSLFLLECHACSSSQTHQKFRQKWPFRCKSAFPWCCLL